MTSNTVDWSKFQSDYVKWAEVHQVVEGSTVDVGIGSYQGKEYPELKIRTADGVVTLSASQTQLARKLAEDPPAIGDHVRVEYLGEADTAKPGQSPAKLFKVDVTHKGASAPAASSDLV